MTFKAIDASGREQWLESVRTELEDGTYRPQPLLRVWIPKSNGGRRPLGIPCLKDRLVMMATVLVIGPIFEADLLDNQYGFRPGKDAKMAVRQVFWHIKDHGRSEVVDADLRDYFTSIPHGPLMQCLTRRIVDGRVLSTIKVTEINSLLRGWCGYFDQGPVMKSYDLIRRYVDRRLRPWLVRRTGGRGRGFKQYTQDYLHDTLGLFPIPIKRTDRSSAKA